MTTEESERMERLKAYVDAKVAYEVSKYSSLHELEHGYDEISLNAERQALEKAEKELNDRATTPERLA